MDIVFAKSAMRTNWRGRPVRTQVGQPWPADDPFVRDHPELFADVPENLASSAEHGVEQATRAPGEKRTTRRTTKR